jgi:NAD(P)H-nitrite reductase large subunit
MKNVVIMGQSPAAYTAVKALLDRDPSVAITLISCDGQLPYDRMLLAGLIDRSVKEKDIFCAGEDFYKAARVQIITGKEVSRVNFNRKRIFMADKIHVDFEGLIITDGSELRLPAFKGVRRQGVFSLARLGSVKDLVRYLTFTETVVVEPLGFSGIKAALALKAVGKDVIVVVRDEALLARILPVERAQALSRALEKRGIRLVSGGLDDIIGETEVKAVRLKSGKVVACDMVVIEDVAPDLRFLSDTELVAGDRIPVAGPFRTNIPGVHAIDAVCQDDALKFTGAYGLNTEIGSVQAHVAVAGLWGDDATVTEADLLPRDILETFFHPEELVPVVSEVTS